MLFSATCGKFLRLALGGNPGILEVLWAPADCLLGADEYGRELLAASELVLEESEGCGVPRVFAVADTHFGHIEYERRPFRDVAEMDAALVNLWNQTVGDEDTVWHLGDVAACGAERTRELVQALRGRKYLVLGNHDLSRTVTFWKRAGFLEVFEGPVELPNVLLLLSHEPVEPAPGRTNVHGHCHGRGSVGRRAVCVSVELTGYRPVLLDARTLFG